MESSIPVLRVEATGEEVELSISVLESVPAKVDVPIQESLETHVAEPVAFVSEERVVLLLRIRCHKSVWLLKLKQLFLLPALKGLLPLPRG